MRRRGKGEEREIERAKDENCEGGLRSLSAKKMKAEARKISIVMVDVSTEVGDVGAESDRHSCMTW